MDIQGAEGAALEGMKMLLRRRSRLALMMEFRPFGSCIARGALPGRLYSASVKR
jgi:hypothetical protein